MTTEDHRAKLMAGAVLVTFAIVTTICIRGFWSLY